MDANGPCSKWYVFEAHIWYNPVAVVQLAGAVNVVVRGPALDILDELFSSPRLRGDDTPT